MTRILAVMLVLAACATDKRAAPTGDLPQWRLEPVATFAPPTDSGWMRLKAIVADRDGNAYVLDEGASQIRVFDSAGRPVRVIGRKGGGPAEFAPMSGMGLGWIGDTLAVLDPGNGRLTRLTRSGEWVGSWPVRQISGASIHLHQPSLNALYAIGDIVGKSVLIRFTRAGPGDTIRQPEVPKSPPRNIECDANGGIWFTSIPFAVGTIWTAGPAGELVAARTGEYRIAFIGARGDTLRTLHREVEPVAVSDAEWNAGLEEYRAFRQKQPAANCQPSEPSRVRVKPTLRDFVFDDAGNLWVERVTTTGFALDVFDSTGKPLGTMPAPAHDEEIPVNVRGDRLYAIATDESSGLQTARSYRIVRPVEN